MSSDITTSSVSLIERNKTIIRKIVTSVADVTTDLDVDAVLYNKDKTTLIHCPISKCGCFVIPASVTTIGIEAFAHCTRLTSIIIPESVISIGCFAFSNCTNLASIVIPSSVSIIGAKAFTKCTGLESIYMQGAKPIDFNANNMVFNHVNKSNCVLLVPSNSRTLFQRALEWKEFINIVQMTSSRQNETSESMHLNLQLG